MMKTPTTLACSGQTPLELFLRRALLWKDVRPLPDLETLSDFIIDRKVMKEAAEIMRGLQVSPKSWTEAPRCLTEMWR